MPLLMLALIFGNITHAATRKVFRAVDAPPALVVKGQAASVSTAVRRMYFSEKVSVSAEISTKVQTDTDLIQLETDEIRSRLKRKQLKKITYVRYTSGDPRLIQALIDAKNAGVEVEILIDLNPVLATDSETSADLTNHFAECKPRAEDSPGYIAYRAFLAAGFRLGIDLFSQPIYKDRVDERTPIFHEKALVLESVTQPTTLFVSSANSAPNPRVNRTLEFREPALIDYYLEHVRDLKVLFSGEEPKPIREVPIRAPLLIEFKDGSSLRLSFTDGKYNPNDNIVNMLRRLHLKSALLSHFAFTYGKMVDALAENLQIISPEARATVLLDDKFADLITWGVGLSLKGAMVASPKLESGDNRLTYPKGKEVSERTDLFIYQRPALDPQTGLPRAETDEEGPPLARHVNHEKTTMLIDTAGQAYIAWGTLNASGNYHNADMQLDMQVKESSWVVRGFSETIHGLIERDRDKFAFSAVDATLKNAMGMLTGHTDLDVSLSSAREFKIAIWARDVSKLREMLKVLIDQPTALKNVAPVETRQLWIERFISLVEDFVPRVSVRQRGDTLMLKLPSVVSVLTDQKLSPNSQKQLVETIYFGIVPDQRRADVVREMRAKFGQVDVAKESTRRITPKPLIASGFDWDNTVMVMPTKIRLFHRDGITTRDVSTEEFAQIRMRLGEVDTALADWEFRNPESFLKFEGVQNWRDGFFVPDLNEALRDPSGHGEAIEAFVEGLATAKSAKSLYVFTARGNTQQELIMGLVRFREVIEREYFERFNKRITLHLPPRKNLFALSYAGNKISEEKARMVAERARYEFKYKKAKGFRFYEDDPRTLTYTREYLEREMNPADHALMEVLHPRDAGRPYSAPIKKKIACDKTLAS